MAKKKGVKTYILNGNKYSTHEKYTMQDWGSILKFLQGFDATDPLAGVIILLQGDNLTELLKLILCDYNGEKLFEDDFEEVSKIISDFFTRKNSLINLGEGSLKKLI